MINNLMGSLGLYLLLMLLTTVFSYALEGLWGTVKGNNDQTRLAFESQTSLSDGAPTYALSLSSCPGVGYLVTSRESLLLIRSNSANQTCDIKTGQIATILPLLAEKILYFEIFYDSLVLTSIDGRRFLGLRRVRINTENHALTGFDRSPLLMSSGTKFTLCQGDLTADYTSNNIDSIIVDASTVQNNGCSDGKRSENFLNLLKKSSYYRSGNNHSVILYDSLYQRIGQLVPAKTPKALPSVNLKSPLDDLNTQIDKSALQFININPTLHTVDTINSIQKVDVQSNQVQSHADVHLLGAYQPKQIDKNIVPLDKSQKITYIFGLNSIFVAGLCINYNYNYQVKNGVFINVTKNKLRQVKSQLPSAADCDMAGDKIYLNPLEEAKSYELVGSQIRFLNEKGVQIFSLERIEGDLTLGT